VIERETRGPVAVLTLAHGKANAFDLELSLELSHALQEERGSPARAVVLQGRGTIFSAGVDLRRVVAEGAPYVRAFLPALADALAQLFFFPKPLVVAANGHAIAGGAVALASADVRLLAAGGARVGFPELLVGVPFPVIALEAARFVAPPARFQELVYGGATHDAETARALGLADEVVPPGELPERAQARALELASIPPESFRLVKRQMRRRVLDFWEAHASEHDRAVVDAWCAPQAQEAIRAYVARTLRGPARP